MIILPVFIVGSVFLVRFPSPFQWAMDHIIASKVCLSNEETLGLGPFRGPIKVVICLCLRHQKTPAGLMRDVNSPVDFDRYRCLVLSRDRKKLSNNASLTLR